jgi:hypothetical protein
MSELPITLLSHYPQHRPQAGSKTWREESKDMEFAGERWLQRDITFVIPEHVLARTRNP